MRRAYRVRFAMLAVRREGQRNRSHPVHTLAPSPRAIPPSFGPWIVVFATVLRQRRTRRSRIEVDAHRGRNERVCSARAAVRHVGRVCAARCIRRAPSRRTYGPDPSRGSSFLCAYEFWTATNAHRSDAHRRTSGLSASGFRYPFTMGYTFGACAASGGGSA
jgi:hypothetical protein